MSSFLWVRCPEAATWQRVKEMAKRHPHKWDTGADGTLIAVLFTAVEVLPRCYIEVRNYVCLPHITAPPLRSPRQRSLSILAILKKHVDGLHFLGSFSQRGYFLGTCLIRPDYIRFVIFFKIKTCPRSVLVESEEGIKRTAESERRERNWK